MAEEVQSRTKNVSRKRSIAGSTAKVEENYDNNIENDCDEKANSDVGSIISLLILYTLQGLPMGIVDSVKLILRSKGISDKDLSKYALITMPFSLKIFWAPIVDGVYLKTFGRRKSWMFPTQLICGILFVALGPVIGIWLDDNVSQVPNVDYLCIIFGVLFLLLATQDIAVDGWALTMLSKKNVGYAPVSNSIGQAVGMLLAGQGLLRLTDPVWCNQTFGLAAPVFTVGNFFSFIGWIFIVVTITITILKKESPSDEETPNIMETFSHMWTLVSEERSIIYFLLSLLCSNLIFSIVDNMSSTFYMDSGMPRTDVVLFSPIFACLELLLPAYIFKIANDNPLLYYRLSIGWKIGAGLLGWLFGTYIQRYYESPLTHNRMMFLLVFFLISCLSKIGSLVKFVSIMTFFSKISDPEIGGSSMTLYNTVNNLAFLWPSALGYYICPFFTIKSCPQSSSLLGECRTTLHGYGVLVLLFSILSMIWLWLTRDLFDRLQSSPHDQWHMKKSS